MFMKNFKKILICTMLAVSPMLAEPQEMSFRRLFLVGTCTYFGTKFAINQYNKHIKQKFGDGLTYANENGMLMAWVGLATACFASWCDNYPVTYPLACIESAAISAAQHSWKGMQYIALSSFHLRNSMVNSITACDSNFIWGSAMCLGIGLTAWYCRNKYRNTAQIIIHDTNNDEELKKIRAQLHATEQQLNQAKQNVPNLAYVESHIKKMESRLAELQSQKLHVELRNEGLETEIEKLKKEKQTAENNLRDKTETIQHLSDSTKQSHQKLTAKIRDLEKQMTNKEQAIQWYTKLAEERSKEKLKVLQENVNLVKTLEAEIIRLRQQVQDLEETLKKESELANQKEGVPNHFQPEGEQPQEEGSEPGERQSST